MAHSIGVLHAAIATDAEGAEGLLAFLTDEGAWLPLVASGEERLAFIREMAIAIGAHRKILVQIRRFEAGVTVETLDFRTIGEPGTS